MYSFKKTSAFLIFGLLISIQVYAEELLIDKETLDSVNLDDLPEGEIPDYIEVKQPVIFPSDKKIERPVKIRKEELFLVEEPSEYSASEANTEWIPIESPRSCFSKLAGYGKRAKAICFDMVYQSARGPLMVVIPINDDFPNYFAINKYEISNSDFSKYCILSGYCEYEKHQKLKKMPMINVTVDNIHTYAEWLSERTGYKYRLPTPKEWEYAAKSNGVLPTDLNCAVDTNIKKVVGLGVTSVNTGHDNEWGLRNALGNVEEIVEDENGNVYTIGGAYLDHCGYELKPMKKESRSELIGFRLVREIRY